MCTCNKSYGLLLAEEFFTFIIDFFRCCSYVGRLGYGLQGVSVARECLAFHTIVHELGHVIGFWHEQSRPDRDQHVEVIAANVLPGFEFNFNKKAENEIDSQGVGYDYNSIMHYDRNAFARFSSFDTLLARDRSIPIGLARELSQLDILQTNRLYSCSEFSQLMFIFIIPFFRCSS